MSGSYFEFKQAACQVKERVPHPWAKHDVLNLLDCLEQEILGCTSAVIESLERDISVDCGRREKKD